MKYKLIMLAAALTISIASFARTKIGDLYYDLDSENKLASVFYLAYEGGGREPYIGDITIPETVNHDGVTYKVTSIMPYAFSYCYDLTSVTLPNTIEEIGEGAFQYCKNLGALKIPASVKTIGYMAFGGAGLKSVEVDKDNKYFDSRNNCNAIINSSTNELIAGSSKTVIPNTVTKIAPAAFAHCANLTSIVIPNSVKRICNDAFYYCENLTSVTLPEGLTEIEGSTFMGCQALKSITLPESLTTIGKAAFGNSGLESITIPAKVSEIESRAFDSCYKLKTVTNMANVPQTIYDGTFSIFDQLIVPESSIEAYQKSPIWSQFFETNGPTGISNLTDSEKVSYDVIYSLSGQKISKTTKGINIINGKKYVAR